MYLKCLSISCDWIRLYAIDDQISHLSPPCRAMEQVNLECLDTTKPHECRNVHPSNDTSHCYSKHTIASVVRDIFKESSCGKGDPSAIA